MTNNEEIIQASKNTGTIKKLFTKLYSEYSVVLVTLVIFIIACFAGGSNFLAPQNMLNILRNNTIIGIIAFGMSFVIISGNIDLSVGSQLVIVGSIILNVIDATNSIIIGIIVGIACSCLLSVFTGVIVTKGKVPSFVVTLGFMSFYRSVCMFFMNGGGFYGKSEKFAQISNYSLFGVIPMPIIYLFIMFLVYNYISKYTKTGRYIYAVGSNQKATRLSGINIDFVKIKAFVLLGFAVGIAAVIETSRMNSINAASSGLSYEMNSIAMSVIGGVAMSGGKGKLVGTFFGIFIFGIIDNILTLLGVNVFLVAAIKGLIIVLSVLLQKKDDAD